MVLLTFLTGCPYKKIFVTIPKEGHEEIDLKIIPINIFYKTKQSVEVYDIVYKVVNQTSTVQKFDFLKSILIVGKDTFKVENIMSMGNVLIHDKVKLPPNKDTLIGLTFKSNTTFLVDTIKVVLASQNLIYKTVLYQRKRK